MADSLYRLSGLLATTAPSSGKKSGNITLSQWTNGSNARVDDSNYATVFLPGNKRHYHYDYDFGLPSNAVVEGIVVYVKIKSTQLSAGGYAELACSLSWDDTLTSTTGSNGFKVKSIFASDEETTYVFGHSKDLWGRSSWSLTELDIDHFRVLLIAQDFQGANFNPGMNFVQVEIFYSLATDRSYTLSAGIQKPNNDRAYNLSSFFVYTTGLKSPSLSSTGSWSSPNNAFSEDGVYTTTAAQYREQAYKNYNFGLSNVKITGVHVAPVGHFSETFSIAADCQLLISINDGVSYSAAKDISFDTVDDIVVHAGGGSDLWGLSLKDTSFSNSNFRCKIKYVSDPLISDTPIVDWVPVEVFYVPADTANQNYLVSAKLNATASETYSIDTFLAKSGPLTYEVSGILQLAEDLTYELTSYLALPNSVIYSLNAALIIVTSSKVSTSVGVGSWAVPYFALVVDEGEAVTSSSGDSQIYENFNLTIPANAIVTGILVTVTGRATDNNAAYDISISGTGGSSYHTKSGTWGTTRTTTVFGGVGDPWEESWTQSMLSNGNFLAKITNTATNNATLLLDSIQIEVAYFSAGAPLGVTAAPTRFYFPSDGVPAITPNITLPAWTNVTSAPTEHITLVTTPTATPMVAFQISALSAAAAQLVCRTLFISDPLAAQTISGTVKGQVKGRESHAAFNGTVAFGAWVATSAGGFRGTLLDASASDNTAATPPELNGTSTNRRFQDAAEATSITLSSVSAQLNDRIVVEMGVREVTTNTARFGELIFGDDSGTDLGENNTDTGTFNPWIEFSGDITFAGGTTTVDKQYTLTVDLKKSTDENYRLTVDLKKSTDENYRLTAALISVVNETYFLTTDLKKSTDENYFLTTDLKDSTDETYFLTSDLKKSTDENYFLTSDLKKSTDETYFLTATLKDTSDLQYLLSTLLQTAVTKNYSLTAEFQKAISAQYFLTVNLIVVGSEDRNYLLTADLRGTNNVFYLLSADLKDTAEIQYLISANLLTNVNEIYFLTTDLKKVNSDKLYLTSAVLQKATDETYFLTAVLQKATDETYFLTTDLKKSTDESYFLTVTLKKSTDENYFLTTTLQKSADKQYLLSTLLKTVVTKNYFLTADLKKTVSKTYLLSSVLKKSTDETYFLTVTLKKSTDETYFLTVTLKKSTDETYFLTTDLKKSIDASYRVTANLLQSGTTDISYLLNCDLRVLDSDISWELSGGLQIQNIPATYLVSGITTTADAEKIYLLSTNLLVQDSFLKRTRVSSLLVNTDTTSYTFSGYILKQQTPFGTRAQKFLVNPVRRVEPVNSFVRGTKGG